MILQGPHQSAYPSMTTGASVPLRTASGCGSVTAMGRSSRIGRPQLPHLGGWAIRVRSTGLSVPQNGQATVARLLTSVTDTVSLRWNLLVALHDRFRLDLHQHLGGYEPAHRHERAGGPDLPKHFAMRPPHPLPVRDVGDIHARPDDILERRAGLGECPLDVLERLDRLQVGVSDTDDAAVRPGGRRARDMHRGADPYSARVPDDRLPRGPARDVLTRHD